jgi:hypothetical protein
VGAVFAYGGAPAPELWELAVGPWAYAPALVAFDAPADRPAALWRVELARDDAASRAALAAGERSIAHAHAALDDAPRRLAQALAAVRLPDVCVIPGEPGRIERALQHAGDLACGRARVETRVAGALVARTLTSLSSDTELWIGPGLTPAGGALHARSVAVAARTRHAWARVLTLVVTFVRRLAVLGISGGAAALPMAWRFLRDVLREARAT